MIRKFVICMMAVVFGAGLLMAHGDPLLGTVTAVDKEVLTIKDKDSKEVKIMLDAKTKYMMGTKAAKIADVKVGEKVSIDAMMDTKMKMYVAESVTLAAAKPAGSTKSTTTPSDSTKKTPASK